jgi:hypothetical protein
MAIENGRRLWFQGDFSRDRIEFEIPVGPLGHVWDDPGVKIREVYIDGEPRLDAARKVIQAHGADGIVQRAMHKLTAPETVSKARELADWTDAQTRDWRP